MQVDILPVLLFMIMFVLTFVHPFTVQAHCRGNTPHRSGLLRTVCSLVIVSEREEDVMAL